MEPTKSAEMNAGMPATIRRGKMNRSAFRTLSDVLAAEEQFTYPILAHSSLRRGQYALG
jgi:hypothetical protein